MSINHTDKHPDKTSSAAQFELFVLGFAHFAPNNSALQCVDVIRDKLFAEGLAHGRREGYHQALHEMQQATGDAGEFLQTLMLK